MSKRWYVVHTYSGYENRVKSDLEHRIETMGMQDRIFDIEIPMERVTEIKEGGKRETKDSKIFPGYVLVRMEMDDDAWTCVRNTPGVTGFLGGNGKPAPLSRDEYNKMTRRPGKAIRPSAPRLIFRSARPSASPMARLPTLMARSPRSTPRQASLRSP